MGFGRNHPPTKLLRVFTVNLKPGYLIVKLGPICKIERPVQVNFYKRAAMSFLCLMELVPPVSSSSLTIVELVNRLPQNCTNPLAVRVE